MEWEITTNKTHADIYRAFGKLMKKEQVAIARVSDTRYICMLSKGRLAGCVGYTVKNKKVRYKTSFIHPRFRRRGLYSQLFAKRDELLGEYEASAFCSKMSIGMFLKNGFVVKSENGNNIKFVKRDKLV